MVRRLLFDVTPLAVLGASSSPRCRSRPGGSANGPQGAEQAGRVVHRHATWIVPLPDPMSVRLIEAIPILADGEGCITRCCRQGRMYA